jgi:FkbM family methyltransferase
VVQGLKGKLFGGRWVELDPRSVKVGGSWRGSTTAYAYNHQPLAFAHGMLADIACPRIVDVGANTGAFTLLAAHLDLAKVWAIEPNPEIAAILKQNIALNGIAASVLPYAAWDKEAQLTLYVPVGEQSGLARVGCGFDCGGATHTVQARTLDWMTHTFGIDGCDLLKIDVEGAELEVLRGAEGMIEALDPPIMIETVGHGTCFGHSDQDVGDWLTDHGYKKQGRSGPYDYYPRRGNND